MVYERYGGPEVLELRDVPVPVPGERDVLIEVAAASVNRSDWESLIGRPAYARLQGLRRPRQQILGTDVAGRVAAVGSAVTSFRPGDHVFGDIMYHGAGSFAEFACVPETAALVHKPPELDFATAAALPQAAVIALQAMAGTARPGSRVLINGAGGGTGAFAIQLARAAGAEVTGVDNALKQDFVRSLGASHVIDYTTTDYTAAGPHYDFILDLVCHRSMFAIRRALAPGGRYAIVGGTTRALIAAATLGRLLGTDGRRLGVLFVRPNKDDLVRIADMVVAGELRVPIERTWPLDGVPTALGHLGGGRALGKLVIDMTGGAGAGA